MKKERRHYDKEFKQMAVEICYTGKLACTVLRGLTLPGYAIEDLSLFFLK